MTLVPGSPVLVPDDADDDDISILEVTGLKSLLCLLESQLLLCILKF